MARPPHRCVQPGWGDGGRGASGLQLTGISGDQCDHGSQFSCKVGGHADNNMVTWRLAIVFQSLQAPFRCSELASHTTSEAHHALPPETAVLVPHAALRETRMESQGSKGMEQTPSEEAVKKAAPKMKKEVPRACRRRQRVGCGEWPPPCSQ